MRATSTRERVRRDRAIARAYEAGATLAECGDQFNLHQTAVAKILNRDGIARRDPHQRRLDEAAICEDYQERGLTLREIAERHGCSTAGAGVVLKRNGVPTRRTSPKRRHAWI